MRVEGRSLGLVQIVPFVIEYEIDDGSLWKSRRLIHQEPTLSNHRSYGHEVSLPGWMGTCQACSAVAA